MIVPLNKKHLSDIARLHQEYLRTPFRGKAGKQMLIQYYTALLTSGGACGYVAESNGVVAGYVCGIWSHQKLRSTLFKRRLGYLIFWGGIQVISHPQMLVEFGKLLTGSSGSNSTLPKDGYEWRPAVVDPNYRGTGMINQLLQTLIQDAAERGFSKMFWYTESDNIAANSFYRKIGLEPVSEHQAGPITHVRYEISTTTTVI